MKKTSLSRLLKRYRMNAVLSRVAITVGLVISMLLVAGCTPPGARIDQPQEVLSPELTVSPTLVRPGDLISVKGVGWGADEAVYISLRSAQEDSDVAGLFAIANSGPDGNFSISFFYPTDVSWNDVSETMVEALAIESNLQVGVELAMAKTRTATGDGSILPLRVVKPSDIAVVDSNVAENNVVEIPAVEGAVVGDQVNLRMGPSTAYPVLDVIDGGRTFAVLGQNANGEWLSIRLADGAEGWMLRALTDFTRGVPIVRVPPLPAAIPATQIQAWRGEYYDNGVLAGPPVLVRGDQNLSFDWAYGAPAAIVPFDDFSVRWTRALYFPAGIYSFNVAVDDGVRLWIDGELIIDEWAELPLRSRSVVYTFPTADIHLFQLDYFEALERAQIDFWWERVSEYPDWQGAYFSNASLAGDPILTRNDEMIDFDWGLSSPGEGVGANRFSARWVRTVEFEEGLYRFTARMDDGLRLFIDGSLIIDEWRNGGDRTVVVDYPLNRGKHTMRVEYYDNTGNALAEFGWEKLIPLVAFPDWKAEYWSNSDLSGAAALARNDPYINFNWGENSPSPLVSPDNFSVRWTRSRYFDSGTYRFYLNTDDGVRMWIDGQLIVDEWQDGSRREVTADYPLSRGNHDLRVEYYERTGDAMASLWWEQVQQPGAYPDWKGEYWSNRSLTGVPNRVRNDTSIDFDWGTGSPALDVSSDRFSARWTRSLQFEAGTYRIYARADDGVRVWVDDVLVIDRWEVSPGSEVYQTDIALDGRRQLKVEYFDNTGLASVEVWWQKLRDQPNATSTNTPVPTSTAVPTSTPEPTVVLTQEPTSTSEPAVEPTLEPTVEPTQEPTQEPTNVPEATNTPESTVEPTQEPTATSEPEPTIADTTPITGTTPITETTAVSVTR